MPDNVSDELLDDLVPHVVDTLAYSESVREAALLELANLGEHLEQQISENVPSEDTMPTVRMQRAEALQTSVQKTVGSAYSNIAKGTQQMLIPFAKQEAEFVKGMTERVFGFDLLSAGLSSKRLEAVAKSVLVEGSPLEDWWNKQSADTSQRVMGRIRTGILAGETNQQMVRAVRGGFIGTREVRDADGKKKKLRVYQGGLMDTSTREATTIVRTAVQQVSNDALMATYAENQDVLRGVQAIVTLDGRTSKICISRSGGAWDFEGNPLPESTVKIPFPGQPPWHPNCRSALLPIVREFSELLGIPDLPDYPKGTRASMDGQVAGDLTYEEWLKTKPESFQRKVLGRGRYELWKDGQLSLTQLVDPTGRALTLKELRGEDLMRSAAYGAPGKDPRIPPPGSTITRVYKGQTYNVTVSENGFIYNGKEYSSISAVAKDITGAKSINGMKWFDLTKPIEPPPIAPIIKPPPPPPVVPPPQPKVTGKIFRRSYKGVEYELHEQPDGSFIDPADGKKYKSLTAAAKEITGAKSISGPRWFGPAVKTEAAEVAPAKVINILKYKKTWKGVEYELHQLPDGSFIDPADGRKYSTLGEAASAVTGVPRTHPGFWGKPTVSSATPGASLVAKPAKLNPLQWAQDSLEAERKQMVSYKMSIKRADEMMKDSGIHIADKPHGHSFVAGGKSDGRDLRLYKPSKYAMDTDTTTYGHASDPKELRRRLQKLREERAKAYPPEVREAADKRREKILKKYDRTAPKGEKGRPSWRPQQIARGREILEDTLKLVDDRVMVAEGYQWENIQWILTNDHGRAWASKYGSSSGGGRLRLFRDDDDGTLAHEFGHHIEFRTKGADYAFAQWMQDRSRAFNNGGKPTTSMIYPNKPQLHDEMGYDDHFYTKYVGKYYKDGATEVLSMGVEALFSHTKYADALHRDPEHLKITVAALHGML